MSMNLDCTKLLSYYKANITVQLGIGICKHARNGEQFCGSNSAVSSLRGRNVTLFSVFSVPVCYPWLDYLPSFVSRQSFNLQTAGRGDRAPTYGCVCWVMIRSAVSFNKQSILYPYYRYFDIFMLLESFCAHYLCDDIWSTTKPSLKQLSRSFTAVLLSTVSPKPILLTSTF